MTVAVQQFLDSFDTLPDVDKQQVAIEILRRVSLSIEGDVPEEALIGAADQLFLALDAEEGSHAQP